MIDAFPEKLKNVNRYNATVTVYASFMSYEMINGKIKKVSEAFYARAEA